jgi:hypothetical protein
MNVEAKLVEYGVPEHVAKAVRKKLGYGTEGVVYELPRERILKVNFTAPKTFPLTKVYNRVRNKPWAAAMGAHGRLKGRGFWYVAPKLYPIPGHLQSLLDDLGMTNIRATRKSITKVKQKQLDEKVFARMPEELARIVKQARRAGYRDLHGGNVMRTKKGALKFIDVESIQRGRGR